jgi:hypothetical protein
MAGGGTGRGNRSARRQVRLLVLLFGVAYVVVALLWLLGYRRLGLAVSNATLILLVVLVLIVAQSTAKLTRAARADPVRERADRVASAGGRWIVPP